ESSVGEMRRQYRACIHGGRLSRPGERLRRGMAEFEWRAEIPIEICPPNILVPLSQPDKGNADAASRHGRRARGRFGLTGRIRFFARAHGVVRLWPVQIAARIPPQPSFEKKGLRKACVCENRARLCGDLIWTSILPRQRV